MTKPIFGNGIIMEACRKFQSKFTKNVFETADRGLEDTLIRSKAMAESIGHNVTEVAETIKEAGIQRVAVQDGNIYMNTEKWNPFWIKPSITLNNEAAGIFILNEINHYKNFFGITAYVKMVDSLRRPDIIKKGLNIRSNELDYMDFEDKTEIAKKLSKKLKKNISPKEIFASSHGIFYPDIKNATVYKTRISAEDKLTDKGITTCKFLFNDNKDVIGFERNEYDILSGKFKTLKYLEQQEPTEKLPEIVDKSIPYRYAYAYRFGNYDLKNQRYKDGVDVVLSKLRKSNENITINDLQGIKFAKENGRSDVNIGYYSPKSGRSLVFDKFGEFLYRLEYLKDEEGNITDVLEL